MTRAFTFSEPQRPQRRSRWTLQHMIRKLLPKSCRTPSTMTCQSALPDGPKRPCSRAEPSYAGLNKELRDLKKMVTSLESRMQSQKHTMLVWQTSNLVFRAFGDFVWNELADETKVQLAEHGIIDFPGLFYLQSSKEHGTSVAEVARMAYRSLPKDISRYAPILILFKDVGENGAKIAHPTIFQTCLDEFINSLGGSEPNLSPLEVRLFGHLRTTSFSTSNIQRARTG